MIMSEKTKIKSYTFIFIGFICFIAIVDYYVKCFVKSFPINFTIYSLDPFFSITYVRNYGGAFSILQGQNVFLAFMCFLVPIILFVVMRKRIYYDFKYLVACAMISGGAGGNLIDRLIYGYVVDYISVGTFPVFNISDSFITVGAVLLGVLILSEKDAPDDSKSSTSKEEGAKNA